MINTPSVSGYQVSEELYNGSRTLVYRGVREIDSLPVVIKLLKNPYPRFSELVQFRNQYVIAKNLHFTGIIQTYSLEPYQNGYMLVMEDFGGISLKQWMEIWRDGKMERKQQILMEFLQMAIALCNALDILYRDRIIHKDIKPANILINPQTQQVKLIDFSIASLLPKETQTLISPNILEGTLAYISPEQTGRMNRGIDYRTDFYSLGVTFYELLTGELPFQSTDAMELVHCHIAKKANLVHEINPQIPSVLSEIVNKLMAKNAEDRYQSALGLKYDLEKCLFQLKETGNIADFPIAQRDVCDRFIIPDKLYGREAEVQTLLDAFERVSNGASELMLVAGFSGIGKTAVVNEVHKPIVRQRGYFIKGKYDQFNRNIPFSAFVQAFRDLMGQLLTLSDAETQVWKNKILDAVGESGQVIIEVIPELEIIIGQQPPAPELSGTAAQNRFNLLFQKFVQIFTTQEHPLVIFLDDLQWADFASLKLMQLLMSESAGGYLLLIGAYRDNEVSAAHPLMLSLAELTKTSAPINTITLASLSNSSLNQLVADTLSCLPEIAQPLTQLVYQKTQGNPFFSTQFLKALYEDGLITFDWDGGNWQCDIAVVKALSISDDVVEFMALQLRKLPTETQSIFKLAACIGNQFDLQTLAIVLEQSQIETATALWKALQLGLILPTNEIYKFYLGDSTQELEQNSQIVNYKFLHDRVQQAAYSLIPENQKQATHHKIGQLLLDNFSEGDREEKIFEIVNQLNQGLELITQQNKRNELAQLNLQAGRKAKIATAYADTVRYLMVGIELLSRDSWQSQYDLTLALYIEAVEAEYLNTNFQQSEMLGEIILQQAHTLLDKVKVYELKIQSDLAINQMIAAIDTALPVLEMLGFSLSAESNSNFKAINLPSLQDLENFPEMTDSYQLATLRILNSIGAAVVNAKPEFFSSFAQTIVNICIQYGHSSLAAPAYNWYAIFLCVIGDIDNGYHAAQIALSLLERYNSKEFKTIVYTLNNYFVIHRKEHIKETLPAFMAGLENGIENGDLVYSSFCALNFCTHYFYLGHSLEALQKNQDKYNELLLKNKQDYTIFAMNIYRQLVLSLLGKLTDNLNLIGEKFDEAVMLIELEAIQIPSLLFMAYQAKLILFYLLQEPDQAIINARLSAKHIASVSSWLVEIEHYFYYSLALLADFTTTDHQTKQQYLEEVVFNQKKIKYSAHHAPMNHQHKYDLVAAEQHRVLGEKLEAIDLYDRAIAGAKTNEYTQEQALANELAAKFYLNWGKEKVAAGYMQEAYYCYAKWGAKAKTDDLEQRYPQLLQPILQQRQFNLNPLLETIATIARTSTSSSTRTSSTSISDVLDFTSILKAAQSISSSIELDELIANLSCIILENSGANKSVLILPQSDTWQVRAITLINHQDNSEDEIQTILDTQLLDTCPDIPRKIINYIKNTQETVVIDNCQTEIPGVIGEYMLEHQPKSILCTPIINQGHLVGILYLENRLTSGVFTSERLQVINLLCAQAAISLENARLYAQQQEKLREIAAKEAEYRSIFESVNDGLSISDLDTGKIVANNPITLQIHGYSQEECLHLTPADFLHPDSVPLFENYLETLKSGQEFYTQGIGKRKDGSFFDIEVKAVPFLYKGKLHGLTILRDISEQQAALRSREKAEAAVKQKSQELEQALQNLQQAQLQIVQSEKMSALGNLVAGVAHEMNNPLSFIGATLQQAKPTIADITEHLKLYQESLPNPSEDIKDHAEEIDLDYTLEDLPKMIDAMVMACDRLKNISTSLRTFSRADQDYKVGFNIHEGIDSTILILKHRLKANEQRPAIEVLTDYGNLPKVECFPGQLNQVFMNILANAIDALDESNVERSFEEIKANLNRITIKTSVKDQLVKISISDNGKGMNKEVQQKIFDHLFTTKGVGKGTGLGLAIARQIIVEKHGGMIEVDSQLGQGTIFTILLPIR